MRWLARTVKLGTQRPPSLLCQKMMIFSVSLFVNHLKAGLPNPLLHLFHLGIIMITAAVSPTITTFLEPFGFSIDYRQAHMLAFSKGLLNVLLPCKLDG